MSKTDNPKECIRVVWLVAGNEAYGLKSYIQNVVGHLVGHDEIRLIIVAISEGEYLEKYACGNIRVLRLGLPPAEQLHTKCERRSLRRIISETFRNLNVLRFAAKALRPYSIHLIHTQDPHGHILGVLLKLILGGKVIWHWHGAYIYTHFPHYLYWCLSCLISATISISQFVKSTLPHRLQACGKVIYNGIDLAVYQKEGRRRIRDRFSIAPGAHLIGAFGTLDPLKGYRYLIEAVPEILKAYPETYLILVGGLTGEASKQESEYLHQLVRERGIESRVFFAGELADARYYMSDFDVIVVPSIPHGKITGEGFGLVAIESMLAGVPTIVTANGGLPEIVEDGISGKVVPIRDSHALARAILSLFDNPSESAIMADAGRLRIERCFSISKVNQDMLSFYYEIVRGNSHPASWRETIQ